MYVKWFDTGMFYYVISVYLQKLHFLKNSNYPPVPAPVRPDVTGTGTQKSDASKVSAAGTPRATPHG
ncbi:unnamed protein product, partial [Staurois parvus]